MRFCSLSLSSLKSRNSSLEANLSAISAIILWRLTSKIFRIVSISPKVIRICCDCGIISLVKTSYLLFPRVIIKLCLVMVQLLSRTNMPQSDCIYLLFYGPLPNLTFTHSSPNDRCGQSRLCCPCQNANHLRRDFSNRKN